MEYREFLSPVGPLLLAGDETGLHLLSFQAHPLSKGPEPGWREAPTGFCDVIVQLGEYFAGRRRQFDVTLAPKGTPFQRQVWQALLDIPYGTTVSYGALAAHLGRPGASRAVGLANGQNPIPIVIPCHRVIGADGTLTGYGGGLDIKRRLLELEQGIGRLFGSPTMAR